MEDLIGREKGRWMGVDRMEGQGKEWYRVDGRWEDGKMGRWEEEKLEPGRWKEWNECGNV